MGQYKPRAKAVTFTQRFVNQRGKIWHALLKAEMEMNVAESSILIQELIDGYLDLVRLKLATNGENDVK